MAMLSGYCMVSGTTSQRWTCDSSTVHIEEFDAADCLETIVPSRPMLMLDNVSPRVSTTLRRLRSFI
eukprot:gene2802-2984_t